MPKVNEKSRLTLIKRISEGKHPRGLFLCQCGISKEIIIHSVTKGLIISCGCYHREITTTHGLTKHPLYKSWANMKDRCYNEKCDIYPEYGGIGVKVCNQWIHDFKCYYDWCMANGWIKGKMIDKDIIAFKLKVKPNLYSPERCTVVTVKENNNVKSNSRMIEYNGIVQSLATWSELLGVNARLLYNRLKNNNWIMKDEYKKQARIWVRKINKIT